MACNGVEWKVNVSKNSADTLLVEPEVGKRIYEQILKSFGKIGGFFQKAWNIGASEPKKVIHGVKVGIALSLVSLFYYMRPLYDGVGGNAMWAIMTVVVAFEYSVGATIAKSFNRVSATFLAGSLGLGVHWIANHCGQDLEPVIRQASIFILGAAATYSRFIPSVKARFDYGAMIFILTFTFVSMTGYRVDKLLQVARSRVSTIVIGTSICILTSMLFSPVWAGKQLHNLTYHNLQKLAHSLDGCVTDYFKDKDETSSGKKDGYKSVLNSKATEVTMANLARWEPGHGRFKFRHPWKQYLRIGASMRSCAYCIETLTGYIDSQLQAPELLKKHMRESCMTLSSCSSDVLKDLAITIKTMTKSTKTDFLVQEMNFAVQSFQKVFKDLSNPPVLEENSRKPQIVPILEISPLATMVLLLIEIAERVEAVVAQVDELAAQAEFAVVNYKKKQENKPMKSDQVHVIMASLQKGHH